VEPVRRPPASGSAEAGHSGLSHHTRPGAETGGSWPWAIRILPTLGLIVYLGVTGLRLANFADFLDFPAYYFGAVAARRGLDFYDLGRLDQLARQGGYSYPLPPFVYPPPAVILFLPFTLVSVQAARWLWIGVDVAALGAAIFVIASSLGPRLPRWLWPCLPVVLTAPLYYALGLVQISPLLLLLAALTWSAYRDGRPGWSGFWLGLSAVLRITPGFLILLFLARRDGRVVLSALLTVASMTLLAGLLFPGAFEPFVRTVVLGDSFSLNPWFGNLSLAGLALRLFTPNNQFAAIAELPVGRPALGGLELAGILAIAALGWASRGEGKPRFDLAYGLAIGILLLVEPLTWTHSLVLLLLPVLIYAARARGRSEWLALGLGVLLLSAPLPAEHPALALAGLADRYGLPAALRSPVPNWAPAWWALALAGPIYGQILLLGLGLRLWWRDRAAINPAGAKVPAPAMPEASAR